MFVTSKLTLSPIFGDDADSIATKPQMTRENLEIEVMWTLCAELGLLLILFSTRSPVGASSNVTQQNVAFQDGYFNNKPPTEDGKPVVTDLSVVIYQIAEISEIHRYLRLNFYFNMRWKDVYVDTEGSVTALSEEQMEKIWKPTIQVSNMESMTPRPGSKAVIFVLKDHIVRYFYGFILVVPCPFDFSSYPFDIQVCDVNLTMSTYSRDLSRLKWAHDKPIRFDSYAGETFQSLPRFSISVCAMRNESYYPGLTGNFSRLIARFIMERDLKKFILSDFFPSTVFVVVSWCSFLVTPSVVPGRVALIVTTLLTLVTMYESNISSAPPSVNIQSLNIWLLGCILFVFGTLAEYALVLFMVRENSNKPAEVKTIKILSSPFVPLNIRKEITEERHQEYDCCNLKAIISRTQIYMSNPAWTRHDRISLLVFPVAFLCYSLVYWITFLNNRHYNLSTDECM